MKMIILLSIIVILLITFRFKRFNINPKGKNKKLVNFKNNFMSKEKIIEKIYQRDNEKKSLDPNINISIDLYDSEENIAKKITIHRARLAKFKKSKLNGEIIYMDSEQKLYKSIGKKRYYIE